MKPRAVRAVRFCVCWVLAMLVLLSLVRFKRQDYLTPLYPALALLSACWLSRAAATSIAGAGARASRVALSAAALGGLIAALVLLSVLIDPRPEALLPYLPRGEPSNVLSTVVGRLRTSPATSCLAAATAALIAGAALLGAIRRRPLLAGVALAAVMTFAEVAVVTAVVPTLDSLYDPRPFAARLRRIVPAGQEIIYHRMECHDLVFYAGAPARVVVASKELRSVLECPQAVYVVLRLRCAAHCEGKCIGGCLRRRLEEWPDLPLTLLATNRGLGDGHEQLALIVNQPRGLLSSRAGPHS